MAGLRLTRARAIGTNPAPKVRDLRAQRARDHMAQRYAATTNWIERLSVVIDYVRSAGRAASQVDPDHTNRVLQDAVEDLVRLGDELNELRR